MKELMPTAISRPNSSSVNCQRWTLNAQMRMAGPQPRSATTRTARPSVSHAAPSVMTLLAGLEPRAHDDAVPDDRADRHLLASRGGGLRVEHVDGRGGAVRFDQRRYRDQRGCRCAGCREVQRDLATRPRAKRAPSAATSISTSKVPVIGSAAAAMRATLPANVWPGKRVESDFGRAAELDAHGIAVGQRSPHHPAGAGVAEHEDRLPALHQLIRLREPREHDAVGRRLDAGKPRVEPRNVEIGTRDVVGRCQVLDLLFGRDLVGAQPTGALEVPPGLLHGFGRLGDRGIDLAALQHGEQLAALHRIAGLHRNAVYHAAHLEREADFVARREHAHRPHLRGDRGALDRDGAHGRGCRDGA